MMNNKYDLAVIGAGPGGYVAAIRAAQLGLKTVCIDKRKTLGGTCLNVGCIPSKVLLHSTEFYDHLRNEGQEHGIRAKDLACDFSLLMERKNKIVQGLTGEISNLFKRHQIAFVTGEASFIDFHTLAIKTDQTETKIEANFFILATGSEPIELPQFPFDERQILSSTGALELRTPPKRMIVIGGGVIGVELASVYSRLGSKVTIVEMMDRICPMLDQTLSRQLFHSLKKQGLEFFLSSKVVTAVKQPEELILTIEGEEKLFNISSEAVLVSVGRRPYTKGLQLDKVGVTLSQKGFIPVSQDFRTNQEHIFAIGDVVDGIMLAHRASEEGIVVAEMIAGLHPEPLNYLTIPNVIYTYPEVATVGLTEQEAKEAGLAIKLGSCSFKGNPRARCTGEMEGLVKVVGEEKTGRLIGMHIIGPHASELIAEGMLAIQQKVTLQELGSCPNAHPTLSEAIKEASLNALGHAIHL